MTAFTLANPNAPESPRSSVPLAAFVRRCVVKSSNPIRAFLAEPSHATNTEISPLSGAALTLLSPPPSRAAPGLPPLPPRLWGKREMEPPVGTAIRVDIPRALREEGRWGLAMGKIIIVV